MQPSTVTCRECGHAWPAGAGYCSWCGARLHAEPSRSGPERSSRRGGNADGGRGGGRATLAALAVVLALLVVGALVAGNGATGGPDPGEVEVPTTLADAPEPGEFPPPESEPEASQPDPPQRSSPTCTLGDDLTPCVAWSRYVGSAEVLSAGPIAVRDGRRGLAGIDTTTGAGRWTTYVGAARVVTAHDGVVVATVDAATIGLDAATGRQRWRIDGEVALPDGSSDGVVTTRTGGDAGPHVLRARSAVTGELRADGPDVPADARVTAAGPVVLAHDAAGRRLLAWDRAATGASPTWTVEFRAPRVRPGPVLAEQMLIFELWDVAGGTDAEPELVALDRTSGRELWRVRVDGMVVDAADGVVVASSDGGAVGLDAATGAVRWRRDQARVLSSDAPAADTVLLATGTPPGQDLEAVRRDDGTRRWRQVFTGELRGAVRVGDRLLVWTRTRLVVMAAADGTGIGTVESAVTDAVATAPPIVRTAGRLHRIDLGVFASGPAAAAQP